MPTLLLGIPPPRPPLPRRMPGQGRVQPESQLGPQAGNTEHGESPVPPTPGSQEGSAGLGRSLPASLPLSLSFPTYRMHLPSAVPTSTPEHL